MSHQPTDFVPRDVAILAAVARNRVVGDNGKLPWRIPEDLDHFKSITMGHSLIMGRLTYESIGRPLPGRENIVVSTQPGYKPDGLKIASSLRNALPLCSLPPPIFVIGGRRLWEEAFAFASLLFITKIDENYNGDIEFPEWNQNLWIAESQRYGQGASPRLEFFKYRRKTQHED